ncbi:MAG: SpoIIE family protein phosphatase [Blastocatellia bacterium]|nr:SpoIIE family protein phosphatase [Blastocatellia bacterium]
MDNNPLFEETQEYPLYLSDSSLTPEAKFQVIHAITNKISTSLDAAEILNLIIEAVHAFVPYDVAAIYIIEPNTDGKRIRAQVERGYDQQFFDNLRLKVGEGLVGWVVQNGRGVIIPDVTKDRRYVKANSQTRSEIVAPIRANHRVIGAFNLESHEVNAYTAADLEILTFFAETVAISIEKAFLHQERLEKKRLESELTIARQVQLSLLPDRDPVVPGFDISGANFSSEQVSGDYFDFIPFANQQLGITIADISGKGIPSALIMASFRAFLRAQVRNDFAVRNVFRKVNYLLWESVTGPQYVTAIYGVLDPFSRRFTFADAGHNPMLLIRQDDTYQEISCGNTVLGLFEDREYKECVRKLKPGEILVLYTDGATEAKRDEIELGVDGLVGLIRPARELPAREIVQAVFDGVRAFSQQTVLDDDLTVVVVKALEE